MGLQAAELQRTIELLETLTPAEWTRQTDCPAWDVRRMYLHVLGACEGGASPLETARQMGAAFRHRRANGGPLEAALSAVQVRDREQLTPDELVARLRAVAPRTVRRRTKLLGPARRHMKMKVDGPVVETWTLGYLTDTIYLRDLWLHRVDASRATDRDVVLTADHDGRIVADVVGEWARRHGQPFELVLTGPAGGTFAAGADGPTATMDAVEFCRTVGGRRAGEGLFATIVPF
jgi:uncharacterized protein (TIGR03083 family)